MGFLGFGDYSKPGKGVRKDAPKKKRFFQFWELYARKFVNLIKLNLLFLLGCLPVFFSLFFLDHVDRGVIWLLPCIPLSITVGPSMAAMTKICKCYTEEKPVFLWSDFWKAFRDNFKQAWFVGVLDTTLVILLSYAFLFYYSQSSGSWGYLIPLALVSMASLIAIFANFYVYLMMVSVDLNLFHLLKNSVFLAFLGVKTNFITLVFTAGILALCLVLIPLSLPILLVLAFSSITLISVFNSWQYIYRYLVRPYYIQTGKKNPYEQEEEESIFTDMTGKDAD